MSDITHWLKGLGLERYADAFAKNEIDLITLPELTEGDLKELGLPIGPRRRILNAILALRTTPSSPDETLAARPSSVSNAPLGSESSAALAERRQLTVAFCDLVGSTELTARSDPEDAREVIAGYRACVVDVVKRFEGFIAQYLGDGVLIYFGYPEAHEDDAERAVWTGIDVVKAVRALKLRTNVRLNARVGIATGLVVVGEQMGARQSEERAAVGETPNLAARLQAMAQPGEVLVAVSTRRLVGGHFACEPLGSFTLKGIGAPVEAYRVVRENIGVGRFDAMRTGVLTPFVGRDEEMELLLRRWQQAKAGSGRVVLLSGEPGIGKSRITAALLARLEPDSPVRFRYFCSERHTQSALYPIAQQLERAACIGPDDTTTQRLDKLEALLAPTSKDPDRAVVLISDLLAIPTDGRYPALDVSPQQRKEMTLDALLEHLKSTAERDPVVMVFEDTHWMDPTTLELLDRTIARITELPILVIVTYRPEFQPMWIGQPHVTLHALSRFDRRDSEAIIIGATGGRPLPKELTEQILARTDGIALFIEELTRMLLESGLLREESGQLLLDGPLPSLAVPTTLQASLVARLDRLASVKDVAQIGATIGREFTYELISEVAAIDEKELQNALERLTESGLVQRRGLPPSVTYAFKHALVQDAAYNTILKSRRQQLHARIANSIVVRFPSLAQAEPEVVAHHYQLGGDPKSALTYWSAAGDVADRRSAAREAASHYQAALKLLPELDDSPELPEVELDLNWKLGTALTQSAGYTSEIAQVCYTKARNIASQIGRADKYMRACVHLANFYYTAGKFGDAIAMLKQLSDDDLDRVDCHMKAHQRSILMAAFLSLGQYAEARSCFEEAKRLDDTNPSTSINLLAGMDPAVFIRAYGRSINAFTGHLDRAEQLLKECTIIAEHTAHMPTKIPVMQLTCSNLLLQGEFIAARDTALEGLAVSERFGFKPRIAQFLLALGHARVMIGDAEDGLEDMRRGYDLWRTTGGKLLLSAYAAQSADRLIEAGRIDAARDFVQIGEAAQKETGERHYAAELQRLRGRFAVLDNDGVVAEACYRQAIETAEHQGARLFTLRAATDLATLLQGAGRAEEAIAVLKPIYDEFSSGWDYPDLRKAKGVMTSLRR
jgi:class 3 adenylate cyclase/tetratricopeptide (TPR) repeat protein